jgi:hypothetical protein
MIGGSHGPFCDDQGGPPSAVIAHALDDQHGPRIFDLLPGIRPHCNPALPCNPARFSLLFALGRSSSNL